MHMHAVKFEIEVIMLTIETSECPTRSVAALTNILVPRLYSAISMFCEQYPEQAIPFFRDLVTGIKFFLVHACVCVSCVFYLTHIVF